MKLRLFCISLLILLSESNFASQNKIPDYSCLKNIKANLSFQIITYDKNRVNRRYNFPAKDNQFNVENSTWTTELKNFKTDKAGGIETEVIFRVKRGTLKQAGVGISFGFNDWSTQNYVMIPASVYNGNRYPVIKGGYNPDYPAEMFYSKDCPVHISDNPQLSGNISEESKIEVLTSNASTPALGVYMPGRKQAIIVLTEQGNRFGDYGLIFNENQQQSKASFSITSPGVRELVAGFGDFRTSNDTARNWKEGDEIHMKCKFFVFKATKKPDLFSKFMAVRKDLSGNAKLNNIAPMSSILDFSRSQTDKNRWHESPFASVYFPENSFVNFQLGWVSGLINTFPMLLLNDSMHLARVSSTIDFITGRMQGKSGFFFGNIENGTEFRTDKKIPESVMAQHPEAKCALVRKNADALYWLCKHIKLLKETGRSSAIKPQWTEAARKLADAFVRTWTKYNDLGQYVDPQTGEIMVFNTSSGALAPAGLTLAAQYFNSEVYFKTAGEIANYYYDKFLIQHGFTNGACGDISQDADSETAFALLETYMALYAATSSLHWLKKAEETAALCSTWTISYPYRFANNCDLKYLNVNTTGAIWASSQNKHAAPGICTSSGAGLFGLYRATGNRKYADLLRDIQHAHTEVVEIPGRPTVTLHERAGKKGTRIGCSMERIQISDAEGKDATGNLINTSNGWTETNGMLMALEIPGIYVQTDKNELYVFDHIEVTACQRMQTSVTLTLKNPTDYNAVTSIFPETSADAGRPLDCMAFLKWKKVSVPAHQSITIKIDLNELSIINTAI